MRLGYCFACKTLSRIDDFGGTNPDHDSLLQDWVDRHLHGFHPDDEGAPKGRIFHLEADADHIDRMARTKAGNLYQVLESVLVEKVKDELVRNHLEVYAYRDELREDAGKCFIRHGNPDINQGRGCRDYQSSNLRLGRKNVPPSQRQYLCTYCPYESSVTIGKRALRGDYRV